MKHIIFLLLTIYSQQLISQKWYLPDKKEIISYSVLALSGASFGLNQRIDHHNFSQGNQFWDINLSWKNKYRNYDGGDLRERFFGAKTFLVWATDGYHLTSTVEKLSLGLGASINVLNLKEDLQKYKKNDRWKVIAFKKVLLPLVIRGISFELIYK